MTSTAVALSLAGLFSTISAYHHALHNLRTSFVTVGSQFASKRHCQSIRGCSSSASSSRGAFAASLRSIIEIEGHRGRNFRPFSSTAIMMAEGSTDTNETFRKATNQHKPSPLAGMPIGPSSSSSNNNNTSNKNNASSSSIILRYMYEGGHIGQGRLCRLELPSAQAKSTITKVSISQVIHVLREDGVDFDTFYACAYESAESSGGWMPMEAAPRHANPWKEKDDGNHNDNDDDMSFAIPPAEDTTASRRIDIKLFRRPKPPSLSDSIQSLEQVLDSVALSQNDANEKDESLSTAPSIVEHSSDALHAISSSVPGGKLSLSKGYFGIGILNPKTEQNVGTLLRSSYQLGASVVYTIGGRYKPSSSDTLNVPARIPLIQLNDWSAFAEWGAPKGAIWVCIEMGGTPLSEFEHPRNAIYILGSEDHGVSKSVVRGCQEVVSLESVGYGSYNVAVAGSIVMYDRLMKLRRKEEEEEEEKKKKKEGRKGEKKR